VIDDARHPRVSVITPVYNAGRHLLRAVASVEAQTYRDHEHVIVDDGSDDERTLALLDRVATRPGVTRYRTPRQGPAAARNFAIERARGVFILPLDADDYLAPAYLAETVPPLEADSSLGVVYTWIGFVGGHHGTWRTGGFGIPALLSYCSLHVTGLYRREVWRDVGGYDPRFVESCEDWDFWLGAAARGWRAQCVPKTLAYYRRTRTSRAVRATEREVSARLMQALVDKHRALYERHMDAALVGLYQEHTAMCAALERVYRQPLVAIGARLRRLLRADGGG
jgi:glycosyltransferase involved in cell wall biosynthesis